MLGLGLVLGLVLGLGLGRGSSASVGAKAGRYLAAREPRVCEVRRVLASAAAVAVVRSVEGVGRGGRVVRAVLWRPRQDARHGRRHLVRVKGEG